MKSAGGNVSEIKILVDADACPVKEEIYKVALRHAVPVTEGPEQVTDTRSSP